MHGEGVNFLSGTQGAEATRKEMSPMVGNGLDVISGSDVGPAVTSVPVSL